MCRPAPSALAELGDVLAGPEWDVAVLRGVPGSWAEQVAARTRSEVRVARAPGMGGGAGAIMSARDRIVGERSDRLRRRLRTRGAVHAVWLACGIVVAAVDADDRHRPRGVAAARDWAGGEPLLVVKDAGILLAEGLTAGAGERAAAGTVAVVVRTPTAGVDASGTV